MENRINSRGPFRPNSEQLILLNTKLALKRLDRVAELVAPIADRPACRDRVVAILRHLVALDQQIRTA